MRPDGRKNNQLRPVSLKLNVNRYAEGSCLIQMGHTHVHCTATVEESVPRWMKGSARGWVTAEYAMLPRSCQQRITRDATKGRPNGRGQEIQRLIGRSLRAITDLNGLGERTVWMDCDVLQGDGGTRCAAITGAYVALHQALDKLVKKGVLEALPLKEPVAAVSVGMTPRGPALDLNYEEDAAAAVDMNVIMTGRGRFVELQGTAEREPFTDTQMKQLLALARSGIKQLFLVQRRVLKINKT